MHTGYFEGTLQLRNPNQEVLKFIDDSMNDYPEVFISKKKNEPEGIDLYFSSNKFLIRLGHQLQKKFGGELKINPRIFSMDRQTGKNIYRMNVFYRFPRFRKGYSIKVRGEDYKVLLVTKKVYAQNLKTGQKRWIEFRNIKTL